MGRALHQRGPHPRARTRLMVVRDARERAYSQFVMEIILWKIISCEKSIFENHPDRDRY